MGFDHVTSRNVSHLSTKKSFKIPKRVIIMGTRQLGPRTTRTETSRPVSEDKSARKRGLVGPYVKTTRTINKIDRNHKDTV
jgi:hypothetical protein